MPERVMRCWQCPRYQRAVRRCRDSKANPRTRPDSVAVAETLGLRALCHYNPYRDALALRMHFPDRPLLFNPFTRPQRERAMAHPQPVALLTETTVSIETASIESIDSIEPKETASTVL